MVGHDTCSFPIIFLHPHNSLPLHPTKQPLVSQSRYTIPAVRESQQKGLAAICKHRGITLTHNTDPDVLQKLKSHLKVYYQKRTCAYTILAFFAGVNLRSKTPTFHNAAAQRTFSCDKTFPSRYRHWLQQPLIKFPSTHCC